jgi:hypothetical protein
LPKAVIFDNKESWLSISLLLSLSLYKENHGIWSNVTRGAHASCRTRSED